MEKCLYLKLNLIHGENAIVTILDALQEQKKTLIHTFPYQLMEKRLNALIAERK